MEDSFFEYRDKSSVDSDSEFIDNSLVEEVPVPMSTRKKNNTVFVPESEESADGKEMLIKWFMIMIIYLKLS